MRSWPFVGRDEELGMIRSCLSQGEAVGVVVSGEAGIGKTRLLREVVALLGPEGFHTEWVAATNALASIPFGAVAGLLPAGWRCENEREGLSVLTAAAARMHACGKGRRVVIGVDDANLLDPGSAALIGQLAAQRLAFVVATCRSGESCETITVLWKDGQAPWLDLPDLPETAVDQLVDHALDGDLEGASRVRLRGLAAGNPLALRELMSTALTDRTLRLHHGVWRFTGDYRPKGAIRQLLANRLDPLAAGPRLVAELLACGEPLPHALLAQLVDPAVIDEAETHGLAVCEREGHRVQVRLGHPLYGEVVRAGIPVGRARQLWWRLAQALLATPLRRRDDLLRAAVWQVNGGAVVRPDVVRHGTRQAIDRADLALAERLARAARDAEPSVHADALLAEVLEYRGRSAEAAAVLPEDPPSDDEELLRWALARAETTYWGYGDAVAAERALDLLRGRPGEDLAEGIRSWILLYDGRCAAVLDVAESLLNGGRAGTQALIWALAAATAAAGFLGLAKEAAGYHDRGQALARANTAELPWGVVELDIARCLAFLVMGEVRAAWTVADDGYHRVLSGRSPLMAVGHVGFRGLVECAAGRPVSAGRSLREAISGLDGRDTLRLTRTFTAGLATAAALTGDAEGARSWLDHAEQTAAEVNRLFSPWTALANAWTLAAENRLTDASMAALYAADLARSIGLPTVEALACYDVLRLGGAADCARLERLDAVLGTPFSRALVTAARGHRRGDAHALSVAADSFTRLGQCLLAAEAATGAAGVHRKAGLRGQVTTARERAAELRAQCEGAVTPLLEREQISRLLTRREREVALLAARHSSRVIAERLGVSVATVNNTLARVYAKLGISRRAHLAALVEATPVTPAGSDTR
ncbi:AAA family ATPase [Nonomuraea typhae]|uniref:AAA family ATPase n=1 Tax=Nonomuraea typhae TaxID=2603600 RepID=UPI0012F85D4F|nr:LuxR family transcriptional regulator [Nonomuraea typhae]